MAYSPGEVIALAVIFSFLSLIAVGLRLWARRIMKARYSLDDYFIFVALVITITSGFTIVYDAIYGENARHQDVGPHGEPIMTPRLEVHGKVRYASQLLDLLSFASAKLSVLFLYRRIFALPNFTLIANIFIAIVCTWTISFFFPLLLQCLPIGVQWTMSMMDQAPYCINITPVAYTNCVTDFLLDLIMLGMPIPLLWSLKLSLRKKCAVAGMFALGGVVCLSSLIRLIVFVNFTPIIPLHFNDITYYETPLSYWSQIEASLGVVSACLPVLRPIFVRPELHTRGADTKSSGYGGMAFGDRSDLKDEALQNPFGDRSDLKDEALKNPFADMHEVRSREVSPVRKANLLGVEKKGGKVLGRTRMDGAGIRLGDVGEKRPRFGTEKDLPKLPERARSSLRVGRFGEGDMV